jgi:hypothetical protein
MSKALERFNDLKRKFRAAIPGRKMTFQQHRTISTAASLWQVSKMMLASTLLNGEHDRGPIERLQAEANELIAAASARPNNQEKKSC